MISFSCTYHLLREEKRCSCDLSIRLTINGFQVLLEILLLPRRIPALSHIECVIPVIIIILIIISELIYGCCARDNSYISC